MKSSRLSLRASTQSRSDAATRRRRLFLEQLENRALLTVGNGLNAEPDSYTLDEDTTLNVSAPGVLSNDAGTSATQLSSPQFGSLTFNGDGSFSYSPNADFYGTDAFTYQASDGSSSSDAITVTLNVTDVPEPPPPPAATDDSYQTDEDTPLTISGAGVLDNDQGQSITAAVTSGPSNGSVTMNPDGSFTYTPNADFNGSDSFAYTVTDSANQTDDAQVTITVNSVNDAPIAIDQSFTAYEDQQLMVYSWIGSGLLYGASDPDGDSNLTPQLVSPATHGYVDFSYYGSFIYTPNPEFAGTDSFTFQISDGNGGLSDTATATISVEAVNDAPVAVEDYFTLAEDDYTFSSNLLLNDSDIDSPTFSPTLASNVSNGNLIVQMDGSFVYNPYANFFGTDSFSYYVSDGLAQSNTVTVWLTITEVNDAPIGAPDSYSTNEDSGFWMSGSSGVLGNDYDVETSSMYLTATLITAPTNGTFWLSSDGGFSYTPNPDFYGEDTFTYQASDGQLLSEVTTVTITVVSVNDAPVVSDKGYSLVEDTVLVVIDPALGLLGGASDADGDPLSITVYNWPQFGQLTIDDPATGTFTYIPNENHHGSDLFTYIISDGTASVFAMASLAINDDANFTISGGNSVAEPNSPEATANLSFTVTFIDPPGVGGSIQWRADYPATPGAGIADESDFVIAEGLLEFGPGGGSQTIAVPVLFDTLDEPAESVRVILFNPSDGTNIDGPNFADGTITDTPYVAPFEGSIDSSSPADVDEGSPFVLHGAVIVTTGDLPAFVSITNSATQELLATATVDATTGEFEFIHTFEDDLDDGDALLSQDVVNLTIETVASGTTLEKSVAVTVHNLAPTIEIGLTDETTAPIDAIGDGENILLAITSITDPGAESGNYYLTIDWGDETSESVLIPTNSSWPQYIPHQYAARPSDPEPTHTYRILVTVSDDDTGTSTAATSLLAVKGPIGDKPEVSIGAVAVSNSVANEVRQQAASFKVSRNVLGPDLTVKIVPTHGDSPLASYDDYVLTDSSGAVLTAPFGSYYITIPAGELENIVTLTPNLDGAKEGTETLTLTIAMSAPYDISAADGSTSLSILDGWGVVSFRTRVDEVEEDANVGLFRFGNAIKVEVLFWGGYSGALPLAYSGDATPDDYVAPSVVSFGHFGVISSGFIFIKPIGDLIGEPSEEIEVTLGANPTAAGYSVVIDAEAPIGGGIIVDDDSARQFEIHVGVHNVTNDSLETPEGSNFEYYIRRTGASTKLPQTVQLRWTGTAAVGADVTGILPYTIRFAADKEGELGRYFRVEADLAHEVAESLILEVVPGTNEGLGSQATFNIPANNPTPGTEFTEIWRETYTPAVYSPWKYSSVDKGWYRIKSAIEESIDGQLIKLTTSDTDPLTFREVFSYATGTQQQYGFQIEVTSGISETLLSVSPSYAASFGTSSEYSSIYRLPADLVPIAPVAGKKFYIQPLKRSAKYFEQFVADENGNNAPEIGAAGEIRVNRQEQKYVMSGFYRYETVGVGAILYRGPE